MSDLMRQLIEKDEVTYGMLLQFYLILLHCLGQAGPSTDPS